MRKGNGAAHDVAHEVATLPADVLKLLTDARVKFVAVNKSVTEFFTDLEGVPVRGRSAVRSGMTSLQSFIEIPWWSLPG